GVVLHTNAGDAPLTAPLPFLQRTDMGPLSVAIGASAIALRGRMRVTGTGDFGEVLNLTLTVDSTAATCPMSIDSGGTITASASGGTGRINITIPSGCPWTAASTAPWLTIASAAATGSGVVSYEIAANYGPARRATIEIGMRTITVIQDAAAIP